MAKRGIYPGSFDPFTNGHLDIVKKAAALLDEVYIVIGINSAKKRSFESSEMKTAIEETLAQNNIDNCRVFVNDGLVAEFAKNHDVHYMIRGLRNNMDYNYEENIAEVNKLINPAVPAGYSTLVSVIAIGFGITNISLGIIAEYLWRTYDAARKRPSFLISESLDLKGGTGE